MRKAFATARIAHAIFLSYVALCVPAMARPAAYKMSCRDATDLIARKGAVVLSTSNTTYERFVRDQGFCERGEQITPAWVHSSDIAICVIGYTCEEPVSGIP
jgi:hypothetical protein